MKVHFIAIGGAAMHNLAIALKLRGYEVSGSDDEIFEPSLSRLRSHGILPEKMGWFPERIGKDIDLIILGMHAWADNPELKKALELGLKIYSYPELIFNESKDKKRVVIAGSHGKTTTTSMILHVLKDRKMKFDYMAGAAIPGFDNMVSLSDAELIIIEGDEYFTSPLDRKAKFLWYKPHIAIITGIAWDHINVYPTKQSYEEAFGDFISTMEKGGHLFYYDGDEALKKIVGEKTRNIQAESYTAASYEVMAGDVVIEAEDEKFRMSVFGNHNMQNMEAARLVCRELGVSDKEFYSSISTFTGAAKRLELVGEGNGIRIFRDFAHSPSKLKATVEACRERFPKEELLAVMELHTFSSLNKDFLSEYKGSLEGADKAIVYFSPEVMKRKKLTPFSPAELRSAFGRADLVIITEAKDLEKELKKLAPQKGTILLMSSATFGGLDLGMFAEEQLRS